MNPFKSSISGVVRHAPSPRSFVKAMARLIGALAAMILASHLLVSCDLEIPSGKDQQEATRIVEEMLAKYSFRVMSPDSSRPAIYERPHAGYSEILIFGSYSKKEQDEICGVIRSIRVSMATKPIEVRFYPRVFEEKDLLRKEVFK